MNISYNWLKEYVATDLGPDEIAAALTSTGLETGGVEKVESIPGGLAGIVIGKVLTCVEHPDSDHLHITTVDLAGDGTPTQIVCGAPNVAAGQIVVVATVGTTLYDGEGNSFKIKKSKIRGVESFGMICAEDEIGIGHSHDGIIVLPADAEASVGHPAAEYFDIKDDYVLEVDLTPNRIDAASHFGVARDLAAWLSCHRKPVKALRPSVDAFAIDRDDTSSAVSVDVRDTDGCIRYCGLTMRGVRVAESPEWLRERLTAIGLRPINNVVDVTNYILHAFGQPLHSFDAARLGGSKVVVRRAAEGDKFTTLDGVERTLGAADLMICDATEPKCIAGVFGGLDSGVTEATTDLFLESACFHPTSVRRTARRLGISTDSSFRFERGVDPNGCLYALQLAAMMIKELAGGEIVGPLTDIYPNPVAPYAVDLRRDAIAALVGREIPADTVDSILESLEIAAVPDSADSALLHLQVPTYRYDVRRPCDVIEDILRIYGYNNIELGDELHACLSFKTPCDADNALRRLIAEQLTGAGFNEILNNSLTAENYYSSLAEYPSGHCVRLLNPLSQDLNVMRQTLLFGGLETIAHNINRRSPDLALYEFGNVYACDPSRRSDADTPLAPYREQSRLALWLTGATRQANWLRAAEEATVYDLKAVVLNLLASVGFSSRELRLTVSACPGGSIFSDALDIASADGRQLGRLGIVAPAVARACDVKAPVFFAELDWSALAARSLGNNVTFTALPRTQAVRRDLSLLVDASVTMADIEQTVRASERRLLGEVTLFDVYEGDKLPAGKKSYAISFTLQDPEKTLQDKYIDSVMSKVIANLRSKLGAELR